jgi:hypothetical protein
MLCQNEDAAEILRKKSHKKNNKKQTKKKRHDMLIFFKTSQVIVFGILHSYTMHLYNLHISIVQQYLPGTSLTFVKVI